jgi:hypothetical protein
MTSKGAKLKHGSITHETISRKGQRPSTKQPGVMDGLTKSVLTWYAYYYSIPYAVFSVTDMCSPGLGTCRDEALYWGTRQKFFDNANEAYLVASQNNWLGQLFHPHGYTLVVRTHE